MPRELNPLSDEAARERLRLYSLGRHALVDALRVAGVQPGDQVLLPSFICREVLASLFQVKAKPCFYPVDRRLQPQLPPAAPGIAVVLAVNYFGFAQALEPFHEYGSFHGACLVEDNAHGFLSADEDGEVLGTRGEIGIFSFRKTLAAPDGAAMLLNRQDWIERLPPRLPCRDEALPGRYRLKRGLQGIQGTTGIPAHTAAMKVARAVRSFRGDAAARPDDSEVEMAGTPEIHCEAVRMLERMDARAEVQRRRGLYAKWADELASPDIEPLFEKLGSGTAPYGYPFRANETVGTEVARMAAARGLSCARWPDLPSAVTRNAPDFYRDVWWVNFLC